MRIRNNYSWTIKACCIGYITQAIAVNFAPLLFITFRSSYNISLSQISELITITFLIQLIVDFMSVKFVDKIGYRTCVIAAHILSAAGFILLGILPDAFENPFAGIMAACFFYSFGSGLLEVLVSPIVESCPTDNKASVMGFLHSFYCWGTAIVILVSTLFFSAAGIHNWKVLSILWAIIPLANIALFMVVPINHADEEEKSTGISTLFRSGMFWLALVLMTAAGAAELSMSQWASAFAESGLGVTKAVGDLTGPCMFAVLMGMGRLVYSKFVARVGIPKYMIFSAGLCIAAYLLVSLSPDSRLSLAGCGLTGFAVGAFWPGTYSYTAEKCSGGGTALFAILALAGDAGCTMGPSMVGFMSGAFGDNLKLGLLCAIVFPILLIIGFGLCKTLDKNSSTGKQN